MVVEVVVLAEVPDGAATGLELSLGGLDVFEEDCRLWWVRGENGRD